VWKNKSALKALPCWGNAVDLSPSPAGEGWVRRIKSCLYNSPHPNLLPLEKEIILKSTALPCWGGLGGKKLK